MKKNLLFFILFSAFIAEGQTPAFEWVKQIGGINDDRGNSMVVDAVGNIYTTGCFQDSVDFDPNIGTSYLYSDGFRKDIYVSKYDASGSLIWAKNVGGVAHDYGKSIALDTFGNIYITGTFNLTADFDPTIGIDTFTTVGLGDVFVSKLDSLGNFLWTKQLGGVASEDVFSIAVDNLGNVYTTGYFNDTADFDPGVGVFNLNYSGGGYNNTFISKLDANGNFIWAKSIGDNGSAVGYSLKTDAIGNVYLTGSYSGTVDFDSGTGVFNITGSNEVFILKLDSFGSFVWAKNIGGTSYDTGYSIELDYFGNVYITGFFRGTVDFDPGSGTSNLTSIGLQDVFILKLDILGNFVWAKQMGGGFAATGISIALDALGNIYTTGTFQGTSDFDPGSGTCYFTSATYSFVYNNNVFISKLDSFGDFMWAGNIEGVTDADAFSCSISVDAYENIYIIGYFTESIDFDPNTGAYNVTANSNDIFVHKMSQPPVGIQEFYSSNNSISLYPNPTLNNLTIITTNPTNISIVNLLGQELLNSKIEKSQTIDVSFLSNGIYFVKDLQNGGSIKFIKQ